MEQRKGGWKKDRPPQFCHKETRLSKALEGEEVLHWRGAQLFPEEERQRAIGWSESD